MRGKHTHVHTHVYQQIKRSDTTHSHTHTLICHQVGGSGGGGGDAGLRGEYGVTASAAAAPSSGPLRFEFRHRRKAWHTLETWSLQCPWCCSGWPTLYSLLKHFSLVHSRFFFTYEARLLVLMLVSHEIVVREGKCSVYGFLLNCNDSFHVLFYSFSSSNVGKA